MTIQHHTSDSVSGPERAELVLPDGVTLVADIYRPSAAGNYPVLLMRQPYGRAIASTVVLAHPAWYAQQGYIVVVQDVRGTGDSGGDFQPLLNDAADGAATLDWAAALPGCTGKIGLYGFSYQAATQYLAIAGGGRRPDAIAPAMGSWNPRQDWAYQGGAFRYELCVGWALQMALIKARRLKDEAAIAAFSAAHTLAEIETALLARPDLSHLQQWQQADADHWPLIAAGDLLRDDSLDIPALHIGGWNDYLLAGTLSAHHAFAAANPRSSHLLIGPWAHIPWGPLAGVTDMGPEADFAVDRAQVAFFDFYLKGLGPRPVPVRSFDMGIRAWSSYQTWQQEQPLTLFLGSTGLAAAQTGDGRLQATLGPAGTDRFVSDSTRPAPLVGGPIGTPPGFVDRRLADARSDVAVYTLPALLRPLALAGRCDVTICVDVDAEIFDLCATLSLVTPDGGAHVLATGIVRHHGSGRHELTIDLQAICATVGRGCALRLSLQGAAFPAFEIPGAGSATSYCIHHGGARPSRLRLTPAPEDHINGR